MTGMDFEYHHSTRRKIGQGNGGTFRVGWSVFCSAFGYMIMYISPCVLREKVRSLALK